MVKRCIGIEIGPSYLNAVQISRTAGRFHIEKTFSTKTRRSKDSPSEILRSLTKQHGFDPRAAVAVSMPQEVVFFRTLETDSAGLERMRLLDPAAFENSFPLPNDEIVPQVCSYTTKPDEKYSVLITAVAKNSITQKLDILNRAKMHPDLAESTIFAVHSTAIINHPEITAAKAATIYINESHISFLITQNNNVLIVRNIPLPDNSETGPLDEQLAQLLSQELDITWRKVFGKGTGLNDRLFLAADTISTEKLLTHLEEHLSCDVTVINPYRNIDGDYPKNDGQAIYVSQGLALRLLEPEKTLGTNFIEAYAPNLKQDRNFRKELIVCAALVASIIIIALAGLFIRCARMEAEYARLQNEINSVFAQTLPQEKNIVNPLVQLDQKLQSLQNDYKSFGSALPDFGPLEILHTLTESIPSKSNITINDILITTDSIRLIANAQSFEDLYNWQEILQRVPEFSEVDVLNPNRDTQSTNVRFTILISLGLGG